MPLPGKFAGACLLAIVFAAGSFARSPFPAAPARFEYAEAHMGTRFRVVLYAANEEMAARASRAAFNRIARLDAIMSDYRETSELKQICRRAGLGAVEVSRDLFHVISESQRLARMTDGAFDITAAPLIKLWRRARRAGRLPSREMIKEAMRLTGYDKVHLDEKARAVRLEKEGMMLDLGAIAKGYAVDEAMKILELHGIRSALVAAGGDIRVSLPPPGARGWVIRLAALDSTASPGDLFMSQQAASTSGDAEQYVEIEGIRYSHIVDPKTGLGIRGRGSATVVAPTAIRSDSLATAVNVLGAERGVKLIDCLPGVAAFIIQADEREAREFESKFWKEIPKTL